MLVPLNVKAIMPGDMVLMLFIRSSLAVKFNLSLVNSVGIIDSDYANNPNNDGNIGVKFRNSSCENIIIRTRWRLWLDRPLTDNKANISAAERRP